MRQCMLFCICYHIGGRSGTLHAACWHARCVHVVASLDGWACLFLELDLGRSQKYEYPGMTTFPMSDARTWAVEGPGCAKGAE